MSWAGYWSLTGVFIWVAILLLPWRPWSTRERLETTGDTDTDLGDVTVLIPARNEARVLATNLRALARQGQGLKVVVVDDQSTDGTSEIAFKAAIPDLVVVRGKPLPAGWCGKVWALEQGRRHLDRPLTLLLDADIELSPGLVATLRQKLRGNGGGMVSLMAELSTEGLWAKMLIPAFVFFFRLLYPFRLSNSPSYNVAAAAGGCVLMETRMLDAIGGFHALRDALIDDCALARLAKARGHRTWIGLTRSARGVRAYRGVGGIWDMVARTAFTQLGYSLLWLLLCTVLMVGAFVGPVVGLTSAWAAGLDASRWAVGLSAVGLGAMMLSYLPTLHFYGLSRGWAFAMPIIGMLYLAMTWTSAIRYWRGERSRWKERTYALAEGDEG